MLEGGANGGAGVLLFVEQKIREFFFFFALTEWCSARRIWKEKYNPK